VSDPSAVPRTERLDFQATSDPALSTAADRGESRLLGYRQLYELWERQHWATQDIDFTQDRIDWHEKIDAEERYARMYGLSSFFIGEQRVAAELGPMMRAAPQEDMRLFLCTQIADEARHVAFFDRFYAEVGVLESDNLQERLAETSEHLSEQFGVVFDQMLSSRVDRLAREPEDLETLVETVTIYHMVIEGMLALTGQHFIIDHNERQGVMPGFVAGFTNVARDEHRHVAFGARFLRDMSARDPRYTAAIRRALAEVGPGGGGCPAAAVGRRGPRRRVPRGEHQPDARVRAQGARAPAEGDRAGGGRVVWGGCLPRSSPSTARRCETSSGPASGTAACSSWRSSPPCSRWRSWVPA
jgi:ribonucleoside-diphosphate reductase beta chain